MGVGVNVSNEFGRTVVPWRHYRLTHMDGYMFTMPEGHLHAITWLLPTDSRYIAIMDIQAYQTNSRFGEEC